MAYALHQRPVDGAKDREEAGKIIECKLIRLYGTKGRVPADKMMLIQTLPPLFIQARDMRREFEAGKKIDMSLYLRLLSSLDKTLERVRKDAMDKGEDVDAELEDLIFEN